MRTDTKVGIIGLTYFVVGALMVGKSIDVLTTPQTLGLVIMICGIYLSGYYYAMERK